MVELRVVSGGRPDRVLHPRSPLARRAGITPIVVPSDVFVEPALLAAHRPKRRHLRAVA